MLKIQETQVQSLGQEDPLEKEMATHSSILAWKIPWTEDPDGLQSMGSQRVRHNWAHTHWLYKTYTTQDNIVPQAQEHSQIMFQSVQIHFRLLTSLSHILSPLPFSLSAIETSYSRTFLVVQWLRLHAPKVGAQVWSLARELDPQHCNWEFACHN